MNHAPYELTNGRNDGGLLLLCDHARNAIPEAYGSLGMADDQLERHIAYDIGAEALTLALAERLEAPAVQTTYSRLLIDPNRGEDDPTIVMRLSDGAIVPGNHPITRDEINHRISTYHRPYHQAIEAQLDAMMATGIPPMIFSVHSFTPAWKGRPRPWEVAILWDVDPRLPKFLIDGLRRDATLTVGDNEPYDGALKNDTMYQHGLRRGLAHALVEVRQDLIADDAGVSEWADRLAPLLAEANEQANMHQIEHYRSRTDPV